MAPSDFYFDDRAAEMAVAFFEQLLTHTTGEWAGKPFTLQPWQRDKIIKPLFGWKRKADGSRKYRRAFIEIPRKNGKSTLSAGIALYLLFADNEPGAQVYSAAADRDQAGIVFSEAKTMVEQSPALAKRAQIFKKAIAVPGTHSSYKVLSADAYTKHGLNASGVVIDELHAIQDRELVDVLMTSTGSRRQPLVVMITTAGYDRESICWEMHEYGTKVLKGAVLDDEFFVFIAAAPHDADWTKPETWRLANPSLGVTLKLDYIAAECRRAQEVAAYQNTFRRLHLNQWTSQESRWLDINKWDLCTQAVDPRLMAGRECYGGLDLSNSTDIAAMVLDFPPEAGEDVQLHAWLPFFWIPEESLEERVRRDRVPYDVWLEMGILKKTPGNVIDYEFIVRDINDLAELYNIKEMAFDRWGAFQVSTQLEAAGITMVGFGQGFASMSPPTKELGRLVLDKRLAHGGHPILRWMADNMVVIVDAAGNVKPEKKKSREKIDGIVAGIMALDRAMRHSGTQHKSVYATRGLRTL